MSFLLKIHRHIMKTRLRHRLDTHLAHPRGFWGAYVARVMNEVNVGITQYALDQLDLEPGQQVLEIAYGGGVSFDLVLPRLGQGGLHGLDMSPDMLALASKGRAQEIRAGRLDLKQGEVERMPYADASMDRAFAVNAIYFWTDPLVALKEFHRVLKPGGRLVLGLRSKAVGEKGGYSKDIFRFYDSQDLAPLFAEAGFKDFQFHTVMLGQVETHAAVGNR